jgi:hypothetical protein
VKGLAIVPDSSQATGHGAVLPVIINSETTNVTVYYRTDSARSYKVIFGQNAVRVNRYTHDYRNTPIEKQLKNEPGAPVNVAFTQNLAGVRIRVEIPYLSNLVNNGPYVVNQARFVMPVNDTVYQFSGRQAPEITFAGRTSDGFSLPANAARPAAGFVYLYQPEYRYYSLILNRDFQTLFKQYQEQPGYTDYGFNLGAPMYPAALWQNIMTTPRQDGNKPQLILTLTKTK